MAATAGPITVSTAEARAVVARILGEFVTASRGITDADAELAASWLVSAERLGLPAFGVEMLLRDLDRVAGGAVPQASAEAENSAQAVSSIDASGLPGPLVLAAAVRRAEAAISAHGVGIIGIREVGALGVLGLAARTLAVSGHVALVCAQAPAIVAPWGGTAPVIGTNPIAFAAPRSDLSDGSVNAPLVADFATSELTLAELRGRRMAGEALPEGSAIDAAGLPTTDAERAAALLPQGRLGSLAGLFVELLAGAATNGRGVAGKPASGRGAVVIAFDPARAGGTHVAEACSEIAAEWREAGGHLPSRFDALSTANDQVNLTVATAESLFERERMLR